MQTFTYDNLDRLRSAIASPPPFNYSEVYTYSQTTGNLIVKGNMAYTYNAQVTCQAGSRTIAHAVSAAGSNTYSYDCNGNMTQRNTGDGNFTLAYDAENHLIGITGTVTATYSYDGDGKRVKSSANGITTVYIGNYLEWNVSSGQMTKYYYAGQTRIAMRTTTGDLKWLIGDHLSSTNVIANSDGSNPQRLLYKAWGERRDTSGSPPTKYQYTGQFNDSYIKLYWYGSRWYDPESSRFVQPDIIVPEPGNSQAFDRYCYVFNNPLSYSDPSGHYTKEQLDKALGNDWHEKYFGENGVFYGREELLDFLLSEDVTDPTTLGTIVLLFEAAFEAHRLGYDFKDVDAIGARVTVSFGGVDFGAITFDAVLNLASGEFSAFVTLEGGFIFGANAQLVAGLSLIKNLPSNKFLRGVTKSIGGAGGWKGGGNIEGFYGGLQEFQSLEDTYNGLFFGVGLAGGLGVYGSFGYTWEVLSVDKSGYSFPQQPKVIDIFYEIGDFLSNDILKLP